MILFKNSNTTRPKVTRKNHTLHIDIDEKPERPKFLDRSTKERRKYVDTCESVIRSSMEYKDYIKYLRTHMDMDHCAVLPNITKKNGKKYTIEIHHEPFTLFHITDTVIRKKQEFGELINPFTVADEVMDLHYQGKVGLIPLCKTTHELVHTDQIFIPLQWIYQRYDQFYDDYQSFMSDYLKDLIDLKVQMSVKCDAIQSNVLEPDVTYVEVDEFLFPETPEGWQNLRKRSELDEDSQKTE